jgi:hypothetical protein
MKQLHEYDTPENAELVDAMNGEDDAAHLIALDALSRNLEQRLAACRDALALVLQRGENMQNSDQYLYEVLHTCRKTLTLTAPK